MKNRTKKISLIFTVVVLAALLSIAVIGLSACKDNTDKSNLTVTYDDTHVVYVGDELESLKPYLTVTYTDNDGTTSTVTDYTLIGTLVKGTSNVTIKYSNFTYMITFNVSERAQVIIPNVYTVTFKADGIVVDTQDYTENDKQISVPDVPVKTGYLGEWEDYTLANEDITVNAVYTAKQYNVTLNYNGATGGNTQQTFTVTYNQPIGTLPIPTREGYAYGWYHQERLIEPFSIWNIDSDVTLVANWEEATTDLHYQLINDGKEYCVTNTNRVKNKEVIIPSVYQSRPVTRIGGWITSVDDYNYDIINVKIGRNVEIIGNGALQRCENLVSVTIPDGVKIIERDAFGQCSSLASIEIPNSVTLIGESAFSGCSSIKKISIPNSVSKIGNSAFANCCSLIEINFNAVACSDFYGDSRVFYNVGLSELITVNIGKSVTKIPAYFLYPSDSKSKISKIIFEENSMCRSIGDSAFSCCSNLVDIKLPDSIVNIGDSSFELTGIKNILIPCNVADIGQDAFLSTWNLENITVDESNKYYSSVDGVLFDKAKNILFKYPRKDNYSYVVPSSVKTIERYAFNATSIVDIKLPEGLENIKYGAFSGCSKLKYINIPNSIKTIGVDAFPENNENGEYLNFPFYTQYKWCVYIGNAQNPYLVLYRARWLNEYIEEIHPNTKVIADKGMTCLGSLMISKEGITVPDSVEYIGNGAFCGSNGYNVNINIGKNVKEIGEYVFAKQGQSIVKSINVSPDNQYYTSENGVLYNKDKTELIAYTSANADVTEFTVPSTVKTIKSYAFYSAGYLTDIILSENLEIIEDGAFCGCSSLININIPDKVTSFGEKSFNGCVNLTEITISSCVSNFGQAAFYGCDNLRDVYYTGSIEEWCNINFVSYLNSNPLCGGRNTVRNLYINNELVSELIIPQGVTEIKANAFYGSSITSVVIPDTVTAIGDYAFVNCKNLTNVYFNGTIVQWKAIEKGYAWKRSIPATKVICLDGEIAL